MSYIVSVNKILYTVCCGVFSTEKGVFYSDELNGLLIANPENYINQLSKGIVSMVKVTL